MKDRAELQKAILANLRRAKLVTPVSDYDAIAGFIALAEFDINQRLRARCMIVRATEAAGNGYLTLPVDYLEAVDVRLQNGPALTYWDRSAAADNLARTSAPVVVPPTDAMWISGPRYAVVGDQMEIYLPPGLVTETAAPMIELAYYRKQTLGPLPTDTNRVLQEIEPVYLFGSLAQSAPLLADDAKLQLWVGLYSAAIDAANNASQAAKFAGSRLVQRFRRIG